MARRDGAHLGGGLRDANSRLQPRQHPQIALITHRARFHIERERHPRFRRLREVKSFSHHPDNSESLAVDLDTLAENIWIGSVAPFPETVAQDDFLILAALLFFEQERAANRWMNAEEIEKIRRYFEALNFFRFPLAG